MLSLKSIFRWPDFTQAPVFKFIARRTGPFDGAITLDRSRVYILPTRAGVLFLVLLLVLLLGTLNYGRSLGFVITFLLVGLGNVAMFACWRNLAGLKLSAGGAAPVYAGEHAVFGVQIDNPRQPERYSIAISHDGVEYEVLDVPADGMSLAHFKVKTEQRGFMKAGRFRLSTEFPAGLFVAWTWIEFNMHCLVYPKPAAAAELRVRGSLEPGSDTFQGDGDEDYSGLRKYQSGDSLRSIAWKAVARLDVLYSREFSGGQPQLRWIEWDAVIVEGIEKRLSMMARQLLDAEASGGYYGLRLPSKEISPDRGYEQLARCMKALALYVR